MRIGEIFGIPIRLHFTLLIIVGFIAWSIGTNVFQLAEMLGMDPSIISSGLQSYFIGMVVAVGLFSSVLVHELAHSLTARGLGVEIEEISLWIFGGMASMGEIPRDPNSEVRISVVGPLTSLAIAAVCFPLSLISPPVFSFILKYLAFINVILAGFNLIPAFPMDGGRVLRALLAKRESYVSATEKAATVGKIFAVIIGITGIFFNFFLVLIAVFIYMGAGQGAQNIMVREVLQGVKAKDIMSKEVKSVPPAMSLREFMDDVINVQHTGFPVVEGGRVVGIITLSDVKEIGQDRLEEGKVEDVMEKDVIHFTPEDSAGNLWQEMARNDIGRFPIISSGELVGIATRTDIIRAFRRLSDLQKYRE